MEMHASDTELEIEGKEHVTNFRSESRKALEWLRPYCVPQIGQAL